MQYNINNAVGNIVRGRSATSSILSGIAGRAGGTLGSFLQGLAKAKETADVYLADLETGDKMQLSYVPENITATDAARFQTYAVIERGEVVTPKGVEPTSVSWDAVLPGEAMLAYPFIKRAAWEKPETVLKRWGKWKEEGTKLSLMVTQTGINLHVYLKHLTPKPGGGLGNIEYSVTFVQARGLEIKTVAEADAEKAAEEAQSGLKDRTAMEKPSTVTVGEGQNLWTVAQSVTGDGGNWEDILAYNAGRLASADDLLPGTVLNVG